MWRWLYAPYRWLFALGLLGLGAMSCGASNDDADPPTNDAVYNWQVAAGSQHSCGIASDRTLWCWGDNTYGQIGNGTFDGYTTRYSISSSTKPLQVGNATDWTQVSTHSDHTCGIRANGTLWCWGFNRYGELGNGQSGILPDQDGDQDVVHDEIPLSSSTPVQEKSKASNWTHVSAGRDHTCGIRADKSLWCWGGNASGQLGDGTTTERNSPVQVGSDKNWAQVSAGTLFTCGIRADGTLWCWGYNSAGRLGDGTTTERRSPVQEKSKANNWALVSAGDSHTCGIREDGTLWCWGDNYEGELGDGTNTTRHSPVQEKSKSTEWEQVSAGLNYTCGILYNSNTKSTTLWCWGNNDFGKLGDGTTTGKNSPVEVDTGDWASRTGMLATGLYHTCGVRANNNTPWCWGSNGKGRLGDGTTTDRLKPVAVKTNR